MTRIASIVLIGWTLTTLVRADAPESTPDIASLVTQLGDSDFRLRQAAVEKLQSIGKPALPALEQAIKDPDPEKRTRAAQLARRIGQHPVPGTALDPSGQINGNNLEVKISDGIKVVTVDEGNRHIKITEDSAGTRIEVKAMQDGQDVTETFAAPTVAELRQDNPEAGEIHDRWGGGEGQHFNLGKTHLDFGTYRAPKPVWRRQSDHQLVSIRKYLNNQMEAKNVSPEKRQTINTLVDRLMDTLVVEDGRPADLDFPGGATAISDMIRDGLKEMGIAEPQGLPSTAPDRLAGRGGFGGGGGIVGGGHGHTIIIINGRVIRNDVDGVPVAPAGPKLGVQVQPNVNGGVDVLAIAPDSRAHKMGLQAGDRILKIQGEVVLGALDIARILSTTNQPLSIVGERAEKPLTLEENAVEKPEEPRLDVAPAGKIST